MPQVKSRRLFFPPMHTHTHTWVQISIKGEIWLCVSCVFAGAREREAFSLFAFLSPAALAGERVPIAVVFWQLLARIQPRSEAKIFFAKLKIRCFSAERAR
jgi:hypothetical protein